MNQGLLGWTVAQFRTRSGTETSCLCNGVVKYRLRSFHFLNNWVWQFCVCSIGETVHDDESTLPSKGLFDRPHKDGPPMLPAKANYDRRFHLCSCVSISESSPKQ